MTDAFDACRCFENMKKRYSKRRLEFKKADRSGTSSFEKEKVAKSFRSLAFLSWLDQHMAVRTTTFSNLPNQSDLDSTLPDVLDEEVEGKESEGDPEEEGLEDRNVKTEVLSRSKRKRVKSCGENEKDDLTFLMQTMQEDIKERKKELLKCDQDPDALFGQMVSSEIRQFSPIKKARLKYDIRNLIFKYQIVGDKASPTNTWPNLRAHNIDNSRWSNVETIETTCPPPRSMASNSLFSSATTTSGYYQDLIFSQKFYLDLHLSP